MKFSGKFLTVLSITAAVALPLEKRGPNAKRECNAAIDALYKKYKKEGCNIDDTLVTDMTIPSLCRAYNAKKCQEFKNINLLDLPECKSSNIPDVLGEELTKNNFIERLKHRCTVDENNKHCNIDYSFLIEDAVNDTCHNSQICTADAINYLQNVMNNINTYDINIAKYEKLYNKKVTTTHYYSVNDIVSVIDFLKNDFCGKPKKITTTTKPTTTTTTTKPTTTTTTVKPTTTTTTTKPTTTTTTVKPTTTTTTTVVPSSSTDPVPEPTSSSTEPVPEPTSSSTDPVPEPTTSVAADPVPEPTTSVAEQPTGPADPNLSDVESDNDEVEQPGKTEKHRKCFVKVKKN